MDIYAAQILDHYRHPRQHGVLKNANRRAQVNNSLCGDNISVSLKVASNRIQALKFLGRGCAISQAAMSLLGEFLPGQTVAAVLSMGAKEVDKILGIKISPVRQSCALLGLKAVQTALMSEKVEK